MTSNVKILSLDGGGTWALLQAMTLQDLYPDKTGHKILAEFDMVAANSGGSLVLAGLLLNWTPKQILEMFVDEPKRDDIFVVSWHNRLEPFINRYDTEKKSKV